MTDKEQPYERVLNDGAKVAGYAYDGYALFGFFLFWLFAPIMVGLHFFGHLWGWVFWLDFFAAFPMAFVTLFWCGLASERYSRRGP